MARKSSEQASNEEINRKFERQQRRLNRRWLRNAVSGFVVLAAIALALQFTPYKDVPRDIFEMVKNLVKSFTPGKSTPREPDPKYW